MKVKTLIITILTCNLLLAQNFKFGKVTKEELEESVNRVDPEANAAVLYKKEDIFYRYSQNEGFTQAREVFERIKIYNKEGFEYATKRVRLLDRSATKKEKLTGLKGYTHNIENGKLIKTKLKKENSFEEKTNKFWATEVFTMPNIKEGTVIEFSYTIESPFISIRDVVLQYSIPIQNLDVDIRIPEFFNFKKTLNPKASFYPKIQESKVSRKENLSIKERSSSLGFRSTTSKFSTDDWEFAENVIKITEKNIKPLIEEPYLSSIDNYRAKLILEYEFFKGPDGEIKNYATNWDKVTKTIYDRELFGAQIEKNNYYKEDLDAVLNGKTDELSKAYAVLNFVKSKVKWNDFYGYMSSEGVKKAYKEGQGSSGDINLMLTSMLKYAGLKVNPVLVSTRANGIPIVPTRSGFNYLISGVETAKGMLLLDATNQYTTANVLPTRANNWQGRRISDTGNSEWINIANYAPKSKEVVSLSMTLNNDLSVNGKVRKILSNQEAYQFRNNYLNKDKTELVKLFEKDKGELEISELEISNGNDLSKPIQYTYAYNLNDAVEEIGNKLYFSPLVFLANTENIFKAETRLYPIDFVFKSNTKYMVNIKLPENYKVESLPENAKVQLNENACEFSFISKENGQYLQFIVGLDMNKTLFLPQEYEVLKQFFQTMVDKQSEKVVLVKS